MSVQIGYVAEPSLKFIVMFFFTQKENTIELVNRLTNVFKILKLDYCSLSCIHHTICPSHVCFIKTSTHTHE